MSTSGNTSPTVAEAVALRLAEAGVRRVFGVPGGGSTSVLLGALSRVGIEFRLCHTETGAALMASVEAEKSGQPGVVLATLGPGAASVVNGLAHCRLDRAPVVAITDRLGEVSDLAGYHQRLDHSRLLGEVVKDSMTLMPSRVTLTVDRALALADMHPPGPVHLDLPVDVVQKPVTEDEVPPVVPKPPTPTASREILEHARELVAKAERPVIVAGLGLRTARIEALADIAEALRAPVLTTYKGKGAIDERDKWSAGLITGGYAERPLLERADLLLTVGLDTVEFIIGEQIKTPRVALSTTPGAPGPLPPPLIEVTGDLGATLTALKVSGRSKWAYEEARAYRRTVDTALAQCPSITNKGLHPWEAAHTIAQVLNGEAAVTVDAGAHMFPIAQAWRARGFGKFWISNGLSTMGYALPAAIALSVDRPELPVVCLTGDGGLLMTAGELATAARFGGCMVIVVFDDASLSLIRIKQAEGDPSEGVNLPPIDWVTVAAGFGLYSVEAHTHGDLRNALDEAADRNSPTLLSVSVDPTPYKAMMQVLRGL